MKLPNTAHTSRMAAIKPFRHLVVYPQMLRAMERRWHERQDREPST